MPRLNLSTDDNTLNKILQKLKYVEGSKMFVGDANAITGCSAAVIVEAFSELGKEVKKCKMVKPTNNQCYGALLNVEPIRSEDRKYTIRKTRGWSPRPITEKFEHPVTPLHRSEYGGMEVMAFWIIANGSYTKEPKRDNHKPIKGTWFTIEDSFGRRFVSVRPENWNSRKVNIDPAVEGPYYGRVKISENKTRIEPGLKYINFYEIELHDSAEGSQLAVELEPLLKFK